MSAREEAVTYSIVVPVYRNEENIPDLLAALAELNESLDRKLEVVFVVDGSPDDSARLLHEGAKASSFHTQLLLHSRNFGSFAAIRTGFLAARGRYIAAMAADLQEPPTLVKRFFEELEGGEFDIAVGERISRDDPFMTRISSGLYWRLYRHFVEPQMPEGGVDMFACTREVAEHFSQLEESNSSLVGLLYWLGFRRVQVPYSRAARQHGKSSWTFRKKVRYLADSVFSFTSLPISLILAVGALGSTGALLYAAFTLLAWSAGMIAVPGYTALMIVILLSTSSILLALGVVGTYVWRAYENTKQRPQSIVMRREQFAPPTGARSSNPVIRLSSSSSEAR